ncbi:hypothetical protein PINS_up013700 [Pythium insidiosum]|nr:hypothetical protein PINS_up013700 [Pythium insidiosum]
MVDQVDGAARRRPAALARGDRARVPGAHRAADVPGVAQAPRAPAAHRARAGRRADRERRAPSPRDGELCARVPYQEEWPDRDAEEDRLEDEEDEEEDEEDDEEEKECKFRRRFYDAASHPILNAALEHLQASGVALESDAVRRLDPYGQIGWFVHEWQRIELLRTLPVESLEQQILALFPQRDPIDDGHEDALDEDERLHVLRSAPEYSDVRRVDPTFVERVVSFVLGTRQSDDLVTPASLSEQLQTLGGSAVLAPTDPEFESLLVYMAMIHVELDTVKSVVESLLDQIVVADGLAPGAEDAANVRRGPVLETWISDALVPLALKRRFQQQVAALVASQTEKDWHPGSNGQVLDVVHPSLHCVVFGETKRVAASAIDGVDAAAASSDAATHMRSIMGKGRDVLQNPFASAHDSDSNPSNYMYPRPGASIRFQWLPSEFAVSEDGERVQIRSYINNLHPETHAALYDSIAAVFGRFLPLFENVLSSLAGDAPPHLCSASLSDHGWDLENHWELPQRPLLPLPEQITLAHGTPFAPTPQPQRFELRGTTVQVIVKIAEIHLTPENPRYAGGAWHVEGTAVEGIVATGIYYFGSENITESRLAFRAGVCDPDYRQDDHVGVNALYGLFSECPRAQNVGVVTTFEDRCLVFPNVLQHQVLPFELALRDRPGVRRILAFFVVDPLRRIPSSREVPPQQEAWIRAAHDAQLHALSGRQETALPEALQAAIGDWANDGMTLQQAKAHREALMAERSPSSSVDNRDNYFSLCEH